jgi:heterotetrameric sarcosine oxidase gamma subunit
VADPVARSPIRPTPPATVERGWEVGTRRSDADLHITDLTPLAKVLVRASENGAVARTLGVGFGRAARDERGTLVTGSGPGEWTLISPPGNVREVIEQLGAVSDAEFVNVLDITHGRALVRISGERTPELLSKVCGIDLSDEITPNGAAFRSSVAKVTTNVVRDDEEGVRSYLLHCERSYGQYLFDALLDAGNEFGVEISNCTSDDSRSGG